MWLYHGFSLSLREVELILAGRGIEVSHETIREWGLRFGRDFANTLNRCRVSHQPTRRRERHMKRFKSTRHAQRSLSTHNLFRLRRH